MKSQPLLIPEKLILTQQQIDNYRHNDDRLRALGIDITSEDNGIILIRMVPNVCSAYASADLCHKMLDIEMNDTTLDEQLLEVLLASELQVNKINFLQLLEIMSLAVDEYADCWHEMTESTLLDVLQTSR